MTGLGRRGRRTQHRAGPLSLAPCLHVFPRRVLPHLQSGSKAPAPRGSEGAGGRPPSAWLRGESLPRNLNLQAAQGGVLRPCKAPLMGGCHVTPLECSLSSPQTSPNIHSREWDHASQEAREQTQEPCSKGAWLGGHEPSPAPSVRGALLPRGSLKSLHTRQDTGAMFGERPGRWAG